MIGYYNIANLVTLLGLCSAVGSMVSAARGNFAVAAILLLCSAATDMADGAIARRLKRTDEQRVFGVQLDSLCDMVSFGAAPAVLGVLFAGELWFLAPALALCVCGAIRLAWFNTLAEKGTSGVFFGVPIPVSAVLVPAFMWLRLWLPKTAFLAVFAAGFALLALAYILNIRIKKPRGGWLVPVVLVPAAVLASFVIWGRLLN